MQASGPQWVHSEQCWGTALQHSTAPHSIAQHYNMTQHYTALHSTAPEPSARGGRVGRAGATGSEARFCQRKHSAASRTSALSECATVAIICRLLIKALNRHTRNPSPLAMTCLVLPQIHQENQFLVRPKPGNIYFSLSLVVRTEA